MINSNQVISHRLNINMHLQVKMKWESLPNLKLNLSKGNSFQYQSLTKPHSKLRLRILLNSPLMTLIKKSFLFLRDITMNHLRLKTEEKK